MYQTNTATAISNALPRPTPTPIPTLAAGRSPLSLSDEVKFGDIVGNPVDVAVVGKATVAGGERVFDSDVVDANMRLNVFTGLRVMLK